MSSSGLGGRAEERASIEDEDGGGVDEDDDGGGESCDILPGLIQKARLFSSPFHSHTRQCTLFILMNLTSIFVGSQLQFS